MDDASTRPLFPRLSPSPLPAGGGRSDKPGPGASHHGRDQGGAEETNSSRNGAAHTPQQKALKKKTKATYDALGIKMPRGNFVNLTMSVSLPREWGVTVCFCSGVSGAVFQLG